MTKNKTRRLSKFLAGIALISTVHAAYRLGDEVLLATEHEQNVETVIGKQVYMNWTDQGKERDRKASLVERLYREVSGNWDYFEKQWKRVEWVEVEDRGEEYFAITGQIVNYIEFNSNQKYILPKEQNFVHELAHVRYSSLTWKEQHQFEKDWLEISQDRYHHHNVYENLSPQQNPCDKFIRETAATSCYGADSFEEDVSEVVSLTYLLVKYGRTHPEMISTYVRDVEEATAPRVLEKIALAAEYDFFSPRERDIASDLLRFQFPKPGTAQP